MDLAELHVCDGFVVSGAVVARDDVPGLEIVLEELVDGPADRGGRCLIEDSSRKALEEPREASDTTDHAGSTGKTNHLDLRRER